MLSLKSEALEKPQNNIKKNYFAALLVGASLIAAFDAVAAEDGISSEGAAVSVQNTEDVNNTLDGIMGPKHEKRVINTIKPNNSNNREIKIPPREQIIDSYKENMQYEMYGEAVTNGKMLVELDLREGKDQTDSLMFLAEAQVKNREYVAAVQNYESVIDIRAEVDNLGKNLALPYKQLGDAYMACFKDKIQGTLDAVAAGEEYVDRTGLKCTDQEITGAYGEARHRYHVNEGIWTTEQNDVLRSLLDLSVIKINLNMEGGVNGEVLKDILKEVKSADVDARNLYDTVRIQTKREYGLEEHIDMLPAINEYGQWMERTLRSADAQRMYRNSVEMLKDMRDGDIDQLVSAEADAIMEADSNIKKKDARKQAEQNLSEEIAKITERYDELLVPQLERVASAGAGIENGSNSIGEIMLAQKGFEARDPKTEARIQKGRGLSAMEDIAKKTDADSEASPLQKAERYVGWGDDILRSGQSMGSAMVAYKRAWEILREADAEDDFNDLFGQPKIVKYRKPSHLIGKKGLRDIEMGQPIGRGHNGIYTVTHTFTISSGGQIKNIELDEDRSNAPANVAKTQKFVLSSHRTCDEMSEKAGVKEVYGPESPACKFMGTRGRPNMDWETGEWVEGQRVRLSVQWEGNLYGQPEGTVEEKKKSKFSMTATTAPKRNP
jgi:hypothetical protein